MWFEVATRAYCLRRPLRILSCVCLVFPALPSGFPASVNVSLQVIADLPNGLPSVDAEPKYLGRRNSEDHREV